jgi:hypothetical protein
MLAIQSKARTEFSGEDTDSFTFYCEQRDIDYWLQGNVPIILVVNRPDTREAFWVSVKQYFADPADRQARKIVFNKHRDRFDASVRSRLFDLARPKDSGLYLASLPKSEQLIPNLMRAVFPTGDICFGDTTFRDPKRIIAAFKAAEVYPGSDWVIHGGQVVSFQPLDQPPWSSICNVASVTQKPTLQLAESDKADERRLFVRLLNRCLEAKCRPQGIRFDDGRGLYYFAATENLRTRRVEYKSLARQSPRTVFEAYRDKETKQVRFCRHLAFEGYFRRLGNEWYLEVTPTYRFTRDGRLPDRFAEDRLKGIKRLERHRAVLGQLLTWIDILTKPGDLFHATYPHLVVERPVKLPLDVGIDDAEWFGKEDPDEAAKINNEEAATGLLFIT